MLLYKNQCFQTHSVSFRLPDGVYLNSAPELQLENGLEYQVPEDGFSISIEVGASGGTASEVFQEVLESHTALSEVLPVQAGGLEGFYLIYCSSFNGHIEFHFDLGEEDGEPQALSILLQSDDPETVGELLHHPALTSLLDSLQAI